MQSRGSRTLSRICIEVVDACNTTHISKCVRIVCTYACAQIYISRAGDSRLLLVHEDWYLSEHNTGYIFMGPPWGSNGTLRVERDREVK